ncbi:hypothetical protein JX265_001500 [Neoarthrinium moseri]|uniref:AB hydrolase-1 domain-containing protein n=1 Tax=Neoarthrinium moseri TaxID=1658444 RepID=A0A9P9WV66_9PEZI|nr:hypothetical protein JX265_001500 [Neoarthrinium moseri]
MSNLENVDIQTIVERGVVRLPRKPTATLSYGIAQGHGPLSTTHLLVFLNGLIMHQRGWDATIQNLLQIWGAGAGTANYPSLLTYDRYGQGDSEPDPADEQSKYGHDMREVVRDLNDLVFKIWYDKQQDGAPSRPHLVFVANSIGCVIARLYAETYPSSVAALLLLDSNIANSDLVSIFPDPDLQDFDPTSLPAGVSVADLRDTRAKYKAIFHPSVRNPENLDRRNVADLLPYDHKPVLKGPDSRGAWITVVEHDWDTFAEEGLTGSLKTPKGLTNAYMNPAWHRYNEGLVRLTEKERSEGPVTAKGCGHFIQRDDPGFVANAIHRLVMKLKQTS